MNLDERDLKIEKHNKEILERLTSQEIPINKRWKDLTGCIFSKLKVVRFAGQYKASKNYSYFWTKCSCGSIPKIIESSSLLSKKVVSCGCHKDKNIKERSIRHGLTCDPWYSIAKSQHDRMTNPNSPHYERYGGRGLKFGEGMETIEERVIFYREFFGKNPPKGMQVDRIDNNRGYAKDNVRLVSPRENSLNTRVSHGFSGGLYSKKTRAYSTWVYHKTKNQLCDEWSDDFKSFLAGIGGNDFPKGKYICRLDLERPFGPDNFYFSNTIQRKKTMKQNIGV